MTEILWGEKKEQTKRSNVVQERLEPNDAKKAATPAGVSTHDKRVLLQDQGTMGRSSQNHDDLSLLLDLSPTKPKTNVDHPGFPPPLPTLSALQWLARQWRTCSHRHTQRPVKKLSEGAK